MKPGRFAYHAPRALDEALTLLTEYGDEAKVLAGGQSLMPILNFRLTQIDHLIDINRIDGELAEPRFEPDTIVLPALVRQRQIERSPAAARTLPLVVEALAQVAHPQIRNRGTVCGSLAHADPAAELPAVMSALEATFTIVSADGVRTVPAEDFFLFHLTTALEPDELLLDVRIGRPAANAYSAFREFATRRGDFALAGVAAVCELDDAGVVGKCRVSAAGVGSTPRRLRSVEALAAGNRLDDDLLAAAAEAVRADIDPPSDIHASAAYRRRLTGSLVKRALADVRDRQEASHDRH